MHCRRCKFPYHEAIALRYVYCPSCGCQYQLPRKQNMSGPVACRRGHLALATECRGKVFENQYAA